MNPLWDAAEAALALVLECLGDHCVDYGRVLIETGTPVADCATIAVSIGPARAVSGSCVGRLQLRSHLDIHLIRCCEPVGNLTPSAGYTPPTAEAIQASAACLVRDAWAIYQCIACTACELIGAVRNVTACCDNETGAPEISWGSSSGGCRSATIRIPLIFTMCCDDLPVPPEPDPEDDDMPVAFEQYPAFTLGDGVSGGDIQTDVGAALVYVGDGLSDYLLRLHVPQFGLYNPTPGDDLNAGLFLLADAVAVESVTVDVTGEQDNAQRWDHPLTLDARIPAYVGSKLFTAEVGGIEADQVTQLGGTQGFYLSLIRLP